MSKHYYAMALVELGYQVYFLQPEDATKSGLTVQASDEQGIKLITQGKRTSGIAHLPAVLRRRMEKRHLRKIEKLCGGAFDIVWNFDPYQMRFLSKGNSRFKYIFHLMDYPLTEKVATQLKSADLALAVRKDLIELYKRLGRNDGKIIPHCYAVRPIQDIDFSKLDEAAVKIGYLGNLARPMMDMQGLITIAQENPDIQLVLMGPRKASNLSNFSNEDNEHLWQQLIAIKNVVWTDSLNWREVPSWLNAMDGLIIAHDSGRFTQETSSPHKLLEYFASGKMILSCYIDGLDERAAALITMMQKGESVSLGFKDFLENIQQEPDDKAKNRRAIALERSYRNTAEAILQDLYASQVK